MRTDIRAHAHRRIADHDAYIDAGAGNRYLDSDANAISKDESDHCADVVADAIASAGCGGYANARADASSSQARQLCTVASLARL